MQLETAIVMIVGIVALVSLRLILAVVGKQYAADHPGARIPRQTPFDEPSSTCRVVRGTGRNSHLFYFTDSLTEPAPRLEDVAPTTSTRVVPLPQGQAS